MDNFNIKLNLLKVQGAFLTNLKGKSETKRCLIIPVDDAQMFVGEKGCYLDMAAIAMREPKYSETHCIKQSLPKERYEAMSEEERKNQPILGGMKPYERQEAEVTGQMDGSQAVDNADDLPF